jgi:hypothetical protein
LAFNYGEFAIIKSQATSHETSGNNPRHHFAGAGKVIEVGEVGNFITSIVALEDNFFL